MNYDFFVLLFLPFWVYRGPRLFRPFVAQRSPSSSTPPPSPPKLLHPRLLRDCSRYSPIRKYTRFSRSVSPTQHSSSRSIRRGYLFACLFRIFRGDENWRFYFSAVHDIMVDARDELASFCFALASVKTAIKVLVNCPMIIQVCLYLTCQAAVCFRKQFINSKIFRLCTRPGSTGDILRQIVQT